MGTGTSGSSAGSAPALSLHLGVRDAAPFLPRALAALEKLPAHRVELVFVDDASRDGGPEQLRRLAERRPNVVLVHRETAGGPGATANDALARCTGTWVQRADCDDEIVAEGVLAALELAERRNLDAVLQPYERIEPDGRTRRHDPEPLAPGETPVARYWRRARPSWCAALLRREIGTRQDLRAPEDLPAGEDVWWLREFMAHVAPGAVEISDRLSYRYRIRQGSASHQAPREKARRALLLLDATILQGESFVRRGLLERGFMRHHLVNETGATAVRRLIQAGQHGQALAEYQRLRARFGSAPRLRRQYWKALWRGGWRLLLP